MTNGNVSSDTTPFFSKAIGRWDQPDVPRRWYSRVIGQAAPPKTKKPFVFAGRKDFPWYHPNSYLIEKEAIVLREGASPQLVDLRGLEPLTSSMPWMRSSSCATGPNDLRYALILRDNGRTGKSYKLDSTFSLLPNSSNLLLTGEFRQSLTALHQPAALWSVLAYYSCSLHHV